MDSVSTQVTPRMKRPFGVEKIRPSIYWFFAALVLPVFWVSVKFRFLGNPLPRRGSFILSPNHYSEIDPLVIGVAAWKLGRIPRFMAKASLFKVPVLGTLLRWSGQIPVERSGTQSHIAMAAASQLVSKGRMVIVYPEGSLTRDPNLWPMRGKTGAVRLALEHNIPLIPVAHWGTQEVMGRYSKKVHLFQRKPVDVIVGSPLDLSTYQGKLDHATLVAATDDLMAAIADLLAQLRNEPAPAVRWDPAKNSQTETGRFQEGSDNG